MNGILNNELNALYECTNLDECKQKALNIVINSDIRSQDKNTMIRNINASVSLIKLQTYLTNSWFAFNGMRVK